MELRHEGSATGGNKVRIEDAESQRADPTACWIWSSDVEGSATGGKKVRIEDAEESLTELTQLLAVYGAPTRGLCNRRKQS